MVSSRDITFFRVSLHPQPLPSQDFFLCNHAPQLFLRRLAMLLHASRIRAAYTTDVTFFNAQLPEIFQTRATKDVRAGKHDATRALDGGQAHLAVESSLREPCRLSRLVIILHRREQEVRVGMRNTERSLRKDSIVKRDRDIPDHPIPVLAGHYAEFI